MIFSNLFFESSDDWSKKQKKETSEVFAVFHEVAMW